MPKEKYVEVLLFLPEYYNPDEEGKIIAVEEEKFIETINEIIALNLSDISDGGTMYEDPKSEKITGIWYDDDKPYTDKIRILNFDIIDTKGNRVRVKSYVKRTLLERFRQIAIYVKFRPDVEPIVVRVS